MIRIFAVTIIFFHATLYAQIYNPVPVIGFNHDVVAEGVGNSSLGVTTISMDNSVLSNFVLCTREFAQANAFQPEGIYGLPDSGRFSVPGSTFQMAPFTENNVLYLLGNETGMLELVTPSRFTDFSLLALATEGDAVVVIRFQFADGSTLTFNKTIDDWFNAMVPPTFSGYGRVKRKDGPILTGDYEAALQDNPRFRKLDFVLPCNKTLVSIEVSNTAFAGSQSNRAFILAASGMVVPQTNLTVGPPSGIACAGSPLQISVLSPAICTDGFKWMRNGVLIAGAEGTEYLAETPGIYNAISYLGQVEDTSAPVFVSGLFVSLNLGSLISLNQDTFIEAYGNFTDATVFRWYKNGLLLPGQNGPGFTIAMEDTGLYVIEVSNGNCVASDSVRITEIRQKTMAQFLSSFRYNSEKISLLFRTSHGPSVNLGLFDLSGRCLLRDEILLVDSGGLYERDISAIPPGAYLIKLYNQSGTQNFKILKE